MLHVYTMPFQILMLN